MKAAAFKGWMLAAWLSCWCFPASLEAQPLAAPPGLVTNGSTNRVYAIDLTSALRLARAGNLDIQIARQALEAARAGHESALEQFFPWLSPGVGYHRRDGMAQAVPAGTVSSTHLDSYSPGATFSAQLPLGDAIYQNLASKQFVQAAGHALDSQGQDASLAAAQMYFDLAKAKALVEVLKEVWGVSRQYQAELHEAVAVGIAFKGDELRVQTQTEQLGIAWRQAVEQQQTASAELARLLHLDPVEDLDPQTADLVPMALIPVEANLDSLVRQALKTRPELKQSQAAIAAAHDQKNGALYGPLIPSLNAQVFAGGLGGGPGNATTPFGPEEDYLVWLGWRIGPGGLFDFGRIHASRAQMATVKIKDAQIHDDITRQVVEGRARALSLFDQIQARKTNLATADETLRLTRSRRQFGVGVVLEYLQAQQDYATAKTGYVTVVADYNKAQFGLTRAIGSPIGAKNP